MSPQLSCGDIWVTSAKYERDIPWATSISITLKNWEYNRTEEIGLVTPTPDWPEEGL